MTGLSAIAWPVLHLAAFLAGVGLGVVYFHALRATADLIVQRGSPFLGLILALGRLSLLAAGFYAAVLVGGTVLLAALAGVIVARVALVQRWRDDLSS